ncbi:hypothetical protein FOZ62_013562, partial [Perkinsus olseni]
YDVRTSTGKEGKFFKTNPGSAVGFLRRRDVQTKLGVTKLGVPQAFVQSNLEVREAFSEFTAYDTTSFVVDLLDGGIEVTEGHPSLVRNPRTVDDEMMYLARTTFYHRRAPSKSIKAQQV